MATTPIYSFVTPDLAGTADGPAAMAALAQRVERELTTLRATQEFSQEPDTAFNANTTGNLLHSVNVTTSIIGFITIDANILLGMSGASGSDITNAAFSGWLKILVDDVQVRQYRYHSAWGTRTMPITMNAKALRTAAQTTTNIKIRLDVDNGSAVLYINSHIYVCQFGAPGTG